MNKKLLDFNKLPKDIQDKIIELQTPAEDRFVFLKRLSAYYWLAIAAGIGWCVYMFASTQNYLWEWWMFWLFTAGSLILISLALYSIYKIASAKLAKLKEGYLFTHNECIKTKGKTVEFWNLTELEGFQFREDIKTIEIWIGERVEKIKAENKYDAERLDACFVEWRNNAQESFLTSYVKPELAPQNSLKYVAIFGGLLALLAVSFGAAYAAKVVNRNYDDEQSWKRIESGKTIGDFEEYRQRHPNGKYIPQADAKINDIYSKLKDDYTKKIKGSPDQTAVNALSEVLANAAKLPNRTIYLRISEKRELDDAVVKKMRQFTGLSINTYDYSLPPTEEPFRKDKLSKDLGLTFLPATRSASINFEMTDAPPDNATVIDLNYIARSVENYYSYYWYSNGSMTIFYNPAAKIDFDFSLKAGDGRELYKTTFVSTYTNLGSTGIFDMRDASNYSFDKVYFSAVSQDFNNYLSKQFGFTE